MRARRNGPGTLVRAAAALALIACAALGGAAEGLSVGAPRLGFAGEFAYSRFAPLRVPVANGGREPLGCVVQVEVVGADGLVEGVSVNRPMLLAPGESRTVVVGVYIRRSSNGLRVRGLTAARPTRWRKLDLDHSRHRPATVYLQCGLRRQRAVHSYPADCFPASVVLCTGLQALVVDEVPDWDRVRRRVLADWLRSGGRLVLLRGRSGRWPRFGGELAAIDAAGDGGRVGTGRVHRLAENAETLRRHHLAGLIPAERLDEDDDVPYWYAEDLDGGLTTTFRRAIRPRHRWWLIHLAMLAFVAVVFPGYFLVARRERINHLLLWGGFFAAIGGFAVAFVASAHPGSSLPSPVHSVSLATPLGEGRYLVHQWVDVFASGGGEEVVHYDGRRACFACGLTGQDRYHGKATAGPRKWQLRAAVPSYASFNFTAGFVATGPPLGLQVLDCRRDRAGRVQAMTLRLGPAWDDGDATELFLTEADGERVHRLERREDGRWVLGATEGIETFLSPIEHGVYYVGPFGGEHLGREAMFTRLERHLVKAVLQPDSQVRQRIYREGDRRLHLFVCRRLDEAAAAGFRPRVSRVEDGPDCHHLIIHRAWEPGR